MIKRNSRNIGKIVKIDRAGMFNERTGKVVGFRGDHDKGDPYVCVFVYDLQGRKGSVYPFAGHCLTQI